MRVAIVGVFGAAKSQPGGAQRVSRAVTPALLDLGVSADLYELIAPSKWVDRLLRRDETACTVDRLPPVRLVSPRGALGVARRHYDLVHFLTTPGLYALPLLWRLRKQSTPVVATLHGLFSLERGLGYPYSRLDVWAERIALGMVQHVVVVSNRFRDDVEREYPNVRDRIQVIHHGVDEYIQRPSGSARSQSVVNDGAEILSLGGTERVKGVPFLLDALEQVVNGGRREVHLTLGGIAGGDHQTVMERIEKLRPHATYVGEVEPTAVGELYERCTVYVQPSINETFGLSVLEAMVNGLPVIATRQCGIADLIENGVNGFLVDHGDVRTLADHLVRLLGDPQLRCAMGLAARAAATEWTWTKAAERYRAVYERAVTK